MNEYAQISNIIKTLVREIPHLCADLAQGEGNPSSNYINSANNHWGPTKEGLATNPSLIAVTDKNENAVGKFP